MNYKNSKLLKSLLYYLLAIVALSFASVFIEDNTIAKYVILLLMFVVSFFVYSIIAKHKQRKKSGLSYYCKFYSFFYLVTSVAKIFIYLFVILALTLILRYLGLAFENFSVLIAAKYNFYFAAFVYIFEILFVYMLPLVFIEYIGISSIPRSVGVLFKAFRKSLPIIALLFIPMLNVLVIGYAMSCAIHLGTTGNPHWFIYPLSGITNVVVVLLQFYIFAKACDVYIEKYKQI